MAIPRALPFAAVLALTAGLAHAQVYQWKDAQGVTHYSDAPPPKGQYDARYIHNQVPAPVPAPASASATADAPAGQAADAPADAAEVAARVKANCDVATANFARLQSGDPIGPDADGDGKPDKTLGEDERAEQVRAARRDIANWCNAAAASGQ
ncbi:MAG TPA: DUF4124 domain-containing protein [Xanthomonadaceae bacterium]|jgi:hypothetical protein|nr:DUF4124 domain-containing protein [Xanthomonadaceae bacterium]